MALSGSGQSARIANGAPCSVIPAKRGLSSRSPAPRVASSSAVKILVRSLLSRADTKIAAISTTAPSGSNTFIQATVRE